ncbi:tripartite tricarboxylate transporter substrate binding protein (plasmid) [Sulfitobacter sp. W027]|uniref:Bug family tripartite tricarboxylate transporter substrate binding protein n=1 Tax=Sulfitobacter sp. W027 TaxID=2867025 RepID=UPI0021A36247|nr:tripartite tricarboxylate transporter substrate binding protein [Sulfitobacter sp. W027]UWR35558.1 tripartite tricarboxylate transporter substrate binding protein [Sulfitobacter sp. W027]
MTTFTRRNLIAAVGFATSAMIAPIGAFADSGDPITLVVPYGGGGLIDGLVREIGDMMSEDLGQPVIVENKPGSNGIIGATYAAAAKPDGQTYFIGATGPLSLNVMLREGLTYDLDSFEPVGTMMSGPLTVTIPASIEANTLEELKAYAIELGQPLRYATLGPGSVTHLFGKVLQDKLGVEMVDVAYADNPSAVVDLIGGLNDLNFSTPISLVKYQQAGDVKMLAISSPERHEKFPDLPTTTELGYPELVSSFWFGLLAPKGTPQNEIVRVSAALQNAMQDEAIQTKMNNVGMTPEVGGVDAMQAQLDWDKDFWGSVIKENNITLE